MVGGKNDAHVLGVMAFFHFFGEPLGIGGGGVTQLVGESFNDVIVLVALLSHFVIRANGKAVKRDAALLRPFREGLRKQVQTGDEKKDELVFTGDFLGDFEAGERLARAARHDEFATRSGIEAEQDIGERRLLVLGPWSVNVILRLEDGRGAGLIF